jgi:hypothetical protein
MAFFAENLCASAALREKSSLHFLIPIETKKAPATKKVSRSL